MKLCRSLIATPHLREENLLEAPILTFLNEKQNLSGEALVDLLKRDVQFAELYSLSAGVGEQYTIEDHTQMVVDSFVKEFADQEEVQRILEGAGLTQQQFALFLALHDIGKGRAVQQWHGDLKTRKELELRYTREEISRFCSEWNLETLCPIFTSLLTDDSIGDFLKTRNLIEEDYSQVAEVVRLGAATSGLSPENFFHLKVLFHKIDAASYPYVRRNFFKYDISRLVKLGKAPPMPTCVGYSDSNEERICKLKALI